MADTDKRFVHSSSPRADDQQQLSC